MVSKGKVMRRVIVNSVLIANITARDQKRYKPPIRVPSPLNSSYSASTSLVTLVIMRLQRRDRRKKKVLFLMSEQIISQIS